MKRAIRKIRRKLRKLNVTQPLVIREADFILNLDEKRIDMTLFKPYQVVRSSWVSDAKFPQDEYYTFFVLDDKGYMRLIQANEHGNKFILMNIN